MICETKDPFIIDTSEFTVRNPDLAESKRNDAFIDTSTDDEQYERLYELLGEHIDEPCSIHRNVGNLYRFKVIVQELAPFAGRRERLLEIGCPSGLYSLEYCRMVRTSHGADISEPSIDRARCNAKEMKCSATIDVCDIQNPLSGMRNLIWCCSLMFLNT